ncbi:MAG: glycosyl transferase [Halothiobacillus sp. 14-55-98]|jgi:glycosyltransferase involved in cell wall biosynthesis|nr:MAG: glycosyl transferase [Halothiobacillus sp. 14-55-98]
MNYSEIQTMQIIGSARMGGAENFFLRLHKALNASGIPSLAVTRRGSELTDLVQGAGITARMGNVFDPFSRWSLSRAIKQHKPDIVQTWMGRATRLVHLKPKLRPAHVARLGGFYDPAQYRHAHALVGNTRGICDFLIREGVPAQKVHFIGNFVQPTPQVAPELVQLWRDKLGLGVDDRVIFALGRLHPNKGFDTLIAAFAQLPSTAGTPHLVIAGDGPLAEQLDKQIAQSPVAARIHRVGWQQQTDALFALADLFVCPSRHEPLGNVILEAWGHGLPVLSTRSDGALELITPDENGVLTPIDEPEPMAAAITSLLNLPKAQLEEFGCAGAAELQRHHSQEAVIAQYAALYRQLMTSWV